jgi:hypothetical protein
MPSYSIPAPKRLVQAIEPSTLTVTFSTGTSGGASARAEFSPSRGYFVPKLLKITSDSEVMGEVRVVINGVEYTMLKIDENSVRDVDVNASYGEILADKIILVGTVKTTTTALRKVSLNYCGGVFDYR